MATSGVRRSIVQLGSCSGWFWWSVHTEQREERLLCGWWLLCRLKVCAGGSWFGL